MHTSCAKALGAIAAMFLAGAASAGAISCDLDVAAPSAQLLVNIDDSVHELSIAVDPCTGDVGGREGFDVLAFLRANEPADERISFTDNGALQFSTLGDGGVLEFEINSFLLGGNVDPSLFYALGVIDFGGPTLFGFTFFTPVFGIPGANTVEASISSATTDGPGMVGGTITPAPGAKIQTNNVYVPGLMNAGVDVGPACAVGVPSGVCGPDIAGPIMGPAGPVTGMEIKVGFLGSGGGDAYGLTGHFEIKPKDTRVPSPGVLGLLAFALGGLGLIGRRIA